MAGRFMTLIQQDQITQNPVVLVHIRSDQQTSDTIGRVLVQPSKSCYLFHVPLELHAARRKPRCYAQSRKAHDW